LAIPALLPLAAPGYFFDAHDAHHSVFFLVEFDQAIRDGVIWPVWGPDHAVGFGYPLWLVYAPLAYYVAEAFHLLGLGFTAAVKVTWALSFLVGAAGIYRLARRWWGPAAGLVAAVAFTYTPYHLIQIYVRAALAEFVALAWFPWVLLAFVALWDDPRPRRAALAALAVGALLLTHTVSTLIFVPLLGGFLLVKLLTSPSPPGLSATPLSLSYEGRERGAGGVRVRSLTWTFSALALGGLLATIFLLPMLLERRYIVEAQWVHDTYNYSHHFVYFSQFFDPRWGYGYSVEGAGDGMSFQLGVVTCALAVLGVALGKWQMANGKGQMADGKGQMANGKGQMADGKWQMANGKWQRTIHNSQFIIHNPQSTIPNTQSPIPVTLHLILATLLALFAMTPASKPLWDALPLVGLIQFPWRLLALTTVTLALLAGAGVRGLEGRREEGKAAATSPYPYVFALVIVLASFPYIRPELLPIRPEDEGPVAVIEFETRHPDMRGMTYWSERLPADADSPLLAQYLAGEPLRRAAIVAGQGTILAQRSAGASASAHVLADTDIQLRFYTYYFPGWRAMVDGQPVEISHDPPNGLIGLILPPGEHEVRLRFGATPLRRVAAGISLAALAAILGLFAWERRPEFRHLAES